MPSPSALALLTALVVPGLLSAQTAAPVGWSWKFDATPPARFVFDEMAPGFHLTTESSGVTLAIAGPGFTHRRVAETRMVLFPGSSQEGFGITLADVGQSASWIGFLVRRSGEAAIVMHDGTTETAVTPWKRYPAIVTPDTSGYATNLLRLEVSPANVTFLVNGAVVGTLSRPHGAIPGTEVGLRAGANLNMHVTSYDLITPMATPAPRKPGT